MGYTHYYDLTAPADPGSFAKVSEDFGRLVAPLEHLGVRLGDEFGRGRPVITPEEIRFNGLVNCGHARRDVGLVWPSDDAGGIDTAGQSGNGGGSGSSQVVAGQWCAGNLVRSRLCGGDCSYESFILHRESGGEDCHGFVKTNYRPYDLAVNACLIVAKHHLGDILEVSSDGGEKDWADGKALCQHFLGYGAGFGLDGGR